MSYSFRIRLNRSPSCTIRTELSEFPIRIPGMNVSLCLRASSGKSIEHAKQWSLVGEGYDSEKDALEAGASFRDTLTLALAKLRIGVDLGERAPKGFITSYGLRRLWEQHKQRVLNDVHGLMAYPSVPEPRFASLNVQACIAKPLESFEKEFLAAIALKPNLRDRERLALSLFHSSFFQPTSDSRFLLLVMAVEALIEPEPRSTEAIKHVNSFISETESSSLRQDEKDSLIGSLQWLRDESISQAGSRLVRARLGDNAYQDKRAPKFFSYVYTLRSKLVHGKVPFPTLSEISGVVATLEMFVSDLLTTPLVEPDVTGDFCTRWNEREST